MNEIDGRRGDPHWDVRYGPLVCVLAGLAALLAFVRVVKTVDGSIPLMAERTAQVFMDICSLLLLACIGFVAEWIVRLLRSRGRYAEVVEDQLVVRVVARTLRLRIADIASVGLREIEVSRDAVSLPPAIRLTDCSGRSTVIAGVFRADTESVVRELQQLAAPGQDASDQAG